MSINQVVLGFGAIGVNKVKPFQVMSGLQNVTDCNALLAKPILFSFLLSQLNIIALSFIG